MVKAAIRRGTRLIDVYVTNRDPLMSERLAEAVGREYIRNAIERRARAWFDEHAAARANERSKRPRCAVALASSRPGCAARRRFDGHAERLACSTGQWARRHHCHCHQA